MDELRPRFNSRRSRGLSNLVGRRPHGFTLVELLVVIAIIGILVALLLPAIQAAREAARRANCQSNIHNVALAVLNYESNRKILPEGMTFDRGFASGVDSLTNFGANWVIKILPYLEEQATYDGFFDATNGLDPHTGELGYTTASTKRVNLSGSPLAPVNIIIRMRAISIPVMLCPSDPFNRIPYQGHNGNPGSYARGNYAANAGRAYIHGSAAADKMNGPDSAGWKDPCQRGVMGPNVSVKLRQISDGTTKTFMLGELRAGPSELDSRGVWALGHAGASLLAKYGGNGDDNGPNVCNASADDVITNIGDTNATACGSTSNVDAARECMSVYKGDISDQATARSTHPGGVHMAMCDGSVQFISNDIETAGCFAILGLGNGCCSAWDRMIASSDGDASGPFNGVTGGCTH
jgi:prepilin-type N-terminal cleavage/methylation domain-containing protein/prepilin-type processing-associated H-X9-DG protein